MAAVSAIGAATITLQRDVVGLRKESALKTTSSAPDSVAVGAHASRSNHGVRAQQVENRPIRPAVSFPLFPRNMEAYSGVSGKSTVPLVVLAQELEAEEEIQRKEKKVPIPALNIVMRSDLGVVMERRW
ncbi:hypothetical protein R1flu_022537 [Riccia fluitans]|uniref:Uncharacterized protein n=1 Tax=Riccia fluitans TaxID=41844 RepID=A0ABD1XPJ4_9MARC